MAVPILGKKPDTSNEKSSFISFEFPDDHSIDGVKGNIMNVTPEQIAVAMLYLQRFAISTMAQRDALAAQAEREAMAVRESLAREKGSN